MDQFSLPTLGLTGFDLIVIAVVVISALLGLARGMIREVVGIISWIAALAVAFYAFDQVWPLVRSVVSPDILATVVTALAVFLVPLVVFKLLGAMLATGIDEIGLGFVDRLGGLAFGLVRGVFLVAVGWLIATMLIDTRSMPAWVTTARLEPQVVMAADWLEGRLPDRLAVETRRAAATAGRKLKQVESAKELLGGGGGEAAAPADPAKPGETGYPADQRQRMNQLLEHVN
jgi:membrane protein required for colicin V production